VAAAVSIQGHNECAMSWYTPAANNTSGQCDCVEAAVLFSITMRDP